MNVARPSIDKTVRPNGPVGFCQGSRQNRRKAWTSPCPIGHAVIANAIIYYNSAILSRLLARYGTSPSVKALTMIKKVSPAAWRHIHLNGRYTFRDSGQVIDLDAMVAGLNST